MFLKANVDAVNQYLRVDIIVGNCFVALNVFLVLLALLLKLLLELDQVEKVVLGCSDLDRVRM